MAAGTKVQLRLGERVVAEVSFREDALRIGRMKENDLVINNLAVSRFHAVLRRVGDGFEIEDLGSENGTFVDGVQVKGRAPLAVGAEIAIGKHLLSIRTGEDENLPAPRPAKSDAWDAGKTYFAPDLVRPAAPAAPASAPAEEHEVVAQALDDTGSGSPVAFEPSPPAPLEASAHDQPDPDGLFAFSEEDLQLPPPAPLAEPAPELAAAFDVPAPDATPAPAAEAPAAGGHTLLFDFGATDDLGLSEPSLARVAAQKAAEAALPDEALQPPSAAAGHAGLIVERAGKVERVAAFRGAELIVGRGNTCDLVLAAAGVSRRHARFVREGESFRVIDLGSANGLRVNGERAKERALQVGDVVAIDDFTLTFVIDHEPIEAVVRAAPAAPAAAANAPHVTVLHEAPLATMMEQDVLSEAEEDAALLDGEKELEIVAEVATAPPLATALPLEDWIVEVVVAADELPEPLRAALAKHGGAELKLPAELRVRRR
jgi:pSer/pThr/pTyr-binding forkhead associated (FHA) protein